MKWVFITGATSGMGRACAEYLAAAGYHVIAAGRNQIALKELEHRAVERGWHLHALKLDVTDSASIPAVAERAYELTGRSGIDVLINNAGYGQAGFLADLDEEQVRRQFEVNVFGLLDVTRAFLPQMRYRSTRIINIGSLMSRIASPWTGIYSTAKNAVRALNDVMRVEFGVLGIRVILVEPGRMNTGFRDHAVTSLEGIDQERSIYAAAYRWLKTSLYSPLGFFQDVEPVEVARLVAEIIETRRRRSR